MTSCDFCGNEMEAEAPQLWVRCDDCGKEHPIEWRGDEWALVPAPEEHLEKMRKEGM